jgi:hypothetical protein
MGDMSLTARQGKARQGVAGTWLCMLCYTRGEGRHQTLDIARKLVKAAGMTAGRRGAAGAAGAGGPSSLSSCPWFFFLVEASGVEDKALENGRGRSRRQHMR